MRPVGESAGCLGFLGNAGCGLRIETFVYMQSEFAKHQTRL